MSVVVKRSDVMVAAAKIGCCLATAEKILMHGADAARNRVHRERAVAFLASSQVNEAGSTSVADVVAALEAEMKRYRKALRAIASDNYQIDPAWARGLAKSALKEQQ